MAGSRRAHNTGLPGLQGWRSLFGNAALPVGATDITGHPVRGVMVDVDGVYGFVFEEEPTNTAVSLTLKAGIQYAFDIRQVTAVAGGGHVYGGGS